jgi:hypothetical protein
LPAAEAAAVTAPAPLPAAVALAQQPAPAATPDVEERKLVIISKKVCLKSVLTLPLNNRQTLNPATLNKIFL